MLGKMLLNSVLIRLKIQKTYHKSDLFSKTYTEFIVISVCSQGQKKKGP